MNRSIFLVLKTRDANVFPGVRLTCDEHVFLAYRLVEARMLTQLGPKHWQFAVGTARSADAVLPMYRKVVKDGTERYLPRIAPNAVRGSFASLLVALESLADLEREKAEASKELAQEIASLEAIVQAESVKEPVVAESSAVASVQQPADQTPAGELGSAPEEGAFERVTLGDGSQVDILWEPCSVEEIARVLAGGSGWDIGNALTFPSGNAAA